jgi:hypothetical protein
LKDEISFQFSVFLIPPFFVGSLLRRVMGERETREIKRNTRNFRDVSRVSSVFAYFAFSFDISSAHPQNPAGSAVFSLQFPVKCELKTDSRGFIHVAWATPRNNEEGLSAED